MEILIAREDFGPVKKDDPVIILPEYSVLLSTFVLFPFLKIPRLRTIELVGMLLNKDFERTDKTKKLFDDAPRNFLNRVIDGIDENIFLVDTRLLKRPGGQTFKP